MARYPIPYWLTEALQGLKPDELDKLAEDAKPRTTKQESFRRTLRRIMKGQARIRSDTLERLLDCLSPPPSHQERIKEIAQQIVQDNDIFRLYLYLGDWPRTGLEIQKLMVEKSWGLIDLAEAVNRLIARERGLHEISTSRLDEIIHGGVALPDELELIACALGVPPQRIFQAQSWGKKIFREVLAASSRKSKYTELNKLLNELRLLLGIRLD
jgi:hypothetical protein